MRVGIDASNLRQGGGITHLVELLRVADPERHGFTAIVVWGGRDTLARLPSRPWLHAVHCAALDGPLPGRLRWQRRDLARLAHGACDVLFAPGGSVPGSFHPVVTMSRNMLPFDAMERRRYGLSWMRLRLALLHVLQGRTFRRADGVIFLNDTARRAVERHTGPLPGLTAVIPHGVSATFRATVRDGRTPAATEGSAATAPFRWLYVSIVDVYKHQWLVVRAARMLRDRGLPVTLDLVGPAYAPAMRRLQRELAACDPEGAFVRYHGAVPHDRLAALYRDADGFVFASTCENMPNILLEAAAAALPIVSADAPVMREVLGDAALYYPPLDPAAMAEAMAEVVGSPALRRRVGGAASERAAGFTWERCARDTFDFLARVHRSAGSHE